MKAHIWTARGRKGERVGRQRDLCRSVDYCSAVCVLPLASRSPYLRVCALAQIVIARSHQKHANYQELTHVLPAFAHFHSLKCFHSSCSEDVSARSPLRMDSSSSASAASSPTSAFRAENCRFASAMAAAIRPDAARLASASSSFMASSRLVPNFLDAARFRSASSGWASSASSLPHSFGADPPRCDALGRAGICGGPCQRRRRDCDQDREGVPSHGSCIYFCSPLSRRMEGARRRRREPASRGGGRESVRPGVVFCTPCR